MLLVLSLLHTKWEHTIKYYTFGTCCSSALEYVLSSAEECTRAVVEWSVAEPSTWLTPLNTWFSSVLASVCSSANECSRAELEIDGDETSWHKA